MATRTVQIEGQTWDLDALKLACADKALSGILARSELAEQLGPSALLGMAATATTASLAQARALLSSDFGFDSARAKAAVYVGGLASSRSVRNDPVGFLSSVQLSAAQRKQICQPLSGTNSTTAVAGDSLSINAARSAWEAGKFRRYALSAARTGDPAVMVVAAAVAASMRRPSSMGFASRLTMAQTYPLASGRSTRLAGRANAVLTAGYTMSALDPLGMDLGAVTWASAQAGWRVSAAPWVYAILDETNGRAIADLLDAAHARQLKFVKPGASPFPFSDSSPELEDARLRIHTYAGRLTKWFDRPMWFDGGQGQAQVLMTQDDRYMYAWVGVDGVGQLVAFDLIDFLPYGQDVTGVRAALALALSWYLDVSVSLRAAPSGTATITRASSGTTKTGTRYMPRPIFAQQIQNVMAGTHAPPQPHGVAAHVRTYINGYRPSARARANAPARLRANMTANQTFVRGYATGQGSLELLEARLSRYSALADTIAGLKRRSQ